jgi:CHASE2 domain-containing sensor protein
VPSLFIHPGTALFQLKVISLKQRIQSFLPTIYETKILAVMTCLSLMPPVQAGLIEQRLWVQALYRNQIQYRNQTHQASAQVSSPLTLVEVDEESIRRDPRIATHPNPINREYMADLVDRLAQKDVKVIGVDYLMDRPQAGDRRLSEAIKRAVNRGTCFVFGMARLDNPAKPQGSQPQIVQAQANFQGNTKAVSGYMPLLSRDRSKHLPLAYLLAWIYQNDVQQGL